MNHLFVYFFFVFFFSTAGDKSPLLEGKEASMLDRKDGYEPPRENGDQRINGIETEAKSEKSADRQQPDIVDDHRGKSRSTFHSPHS